MFLTRIETFTLRPLGLGGEPYDTKRMFLQGPH